MRTGPSRARQSGPEAHAGGAAGAQPPAGRRGVTPPAPAAPQADAQPSASSPRNFTFPRTQARLPPHTLPELTAAGNASLAAPPLRLRPRPRPRPPLTAHPPPAPRSGGAAPGATPVPSGGGARRGAGEEGAGRLPPAAA